MKVVEEEEIMKVSQGLDSHVFRHIKEQDSVVQNRIEQYRTEHGSTVTWDISQNSSNKITIKFDIQHDKTWHNI